MRRRTLALAVVALLMLAGCVPGGSRSGGRLGAELDELEAQMRALTGGECFQATGQTVDFRRQVPCTEVHAYEVLLAVPVPPELGEVALADAVDIGGPVNEALMDHTLPLCVAELARVTGVGAVAGPVPELAGAYVAPALPGMITAHVPPALIWDDYQVMICVYGASGDPAMPMAPLQSPTDTPVFASYGRRDAAEAARTCFGLLKGYAMVACGEPHDAEALFQFDAEVALGAEWVAGVDPRALDDDQWAALDALCVGASPGVFDAERTQTDVAVLAEVLSDAWGKSAPGMGRYPVMCAAYPADSGMRLAGPVWGIGDEPATLVPVT